MIRAILVDDEILVLNLLDKIIRDRQDIQTIATYTDSEEALAEIPSLRPDVLFLDVDMPELNGLELASKLLERVDNPNMAIVFVTAYEQYAIHAFKLNAVHYILKPVDSNSVNEVMTRIEQKHNVIQPKAIQHSEINLFGQIELRTNGIKVDLLTAKIEELLALLVIHGERGISKWRIIDVLWEETCMEKSQQNLYTMVFRLKSKLKSAGIKAEINYKNSIYTMNFEDVSCDLIKFDQFINQRLSVNKHNISRFEKIISLYKGDLLEEKDYLWCVNDKEKYYHDFIDLVMSIATYYRNNNQFDLLKKLYHHVKPMLMEDDFSLLQSNSRH